MKIKYFIFQYGKVIDFSHGLVDVFILTNKLVWVKAIFPQKYNKELEYKAFNTKEDAEWYANIHNYKNYFIKPIPIDSLEKMKTE